MTLIELFQQIRQTVSNKKTYILGGLGVLTGLAHYLAGDTSLYTFLHSPDFNIFLTGSIAISLRAALAKMLYMPQNTAAPVQAQPQPALRKQIPIADIARPKPGTVILPTVPQTTNAPPGSIPGA